MGDYDLHIDIYGNDSNFTSSLDNARKSIRKFVRDVEKDSEGIDKAFEKLSILKSLKGKIDLSNPKAELAKFDEQVRILLKNLDNYFASLQQRLNSITSVVDGKKITSGNASASQVADLQRQHAELMEMARKRQDELEQERAKYRQLAEAIRTNNIPVLHQLAEEEDAASKALRLDEAKNYVKDLNNDMQQLLEKMKDYQSDVEAYKATLEQLQSGGTVLSKDNSSAETIANVTKNLQEAEATLDKMKAEYNDMAAQQKQYSEQVQQSEGHHIRIRTQIMNAREEMMAMIAAGQQGTPAFQQLAEKAGQMRREMALANATMQYFADPNKNLTTLKVGLQGVAGAAGMVTGVIGLFNSENEKMAKIQTQVQSILSIIVGLQTTYNLVKKTSNVMLAIEEVKTWAVAKARGVQAAATGAATVAQEGLNAAMLKNPIGAILSLLTILGTAIYAVARAMTTETEAEKKAREEREAHIKAIRQQHEKWTESVAESASKQIISYNELKRKWNELGDDLKAKEKFVRDNKTAFQNLGFSINDVTDAESLLVKNTEAVVNAIMARARAIAYQETMADNLKAQIKEQMTKTTRSGDYRYSYKAGSKVSNKTLNDRYGKESGRNLLFGNDYTWDDGLIKLTEAGANKLAKLEDDRVKKAQEAKNKRIQTKKEEFNETQKLMEADYENQKKAAEQAGLQVYEGEKDDKKKTDKTGEKEADRRQKLFELDIRQQQEQAKQSQATRAAINAARIASIADDGARQRAEEDEQHRLALEAIQNRENEMKQRLYEYNKSVWEAKNKNPKLQYSDTEEGKAGWQGVSLSEDQRAQNMAETEKENTEYARLIHQRYMDEAEAMRDFLKQYGTIEQQKYAITKEYDQKIAQEQNEWRKKSLEEEKKAALATLDARSLAQNIDWSHAFKGIGNVLKDLAKETLKQVSDYMRSDEFAALPANDKQVYSDLRQQLIDGGGLEASNPFSSKTWDEIATITKEYQENSAALVDAMKKEEAIRKELNNAEQKLALDPTNLGLQAVVATYRSQLNEAGESTKKLTKTVNNQKQDLDDKTESAAKGLNNFNTVVSQITSGSLKGFADGVSNLIMGLTGTGEQMEGIAGVFGEAGKNVGGIIGAILSIMDMLGDKPVEFFDNLFDGLSRCIEAIIAHIPEIVASVVKGAGSIVGSVFTGLGSSVAGIFGGGEDWSAYDEALDKWGGVLDHWEDNVKYERELMEKAYGVKAIQASKDAVEAARKAAQAAEEIYNGWAGSGAGWFSHSNGYNVNEDVNWELLLNYSEELFNKIGATAVSFNNFGREISFVSGDVSNLFNLSWEELEKLKNEAPQFWASIHDTAREYLEQYIEASKAAEEAQEALKEKLIGKTREGVFDEFLDSLYDLADGSKTVFEDIANDWQKMVNRMAINNLVASKFQDSLSEWFDKLYELQQRKLDSDRGDRYGRNPDRLTNEAYQKELEELYNEYLGYFNSAEEMIKVLQELGVIKPVSDVEDELKSSFDNIRDIFRDSLLDLEGDAESFRKKLNEILVKDLLDKNVFDVKMTVNGQDFDNFDAYAEDWNKRYLAALESGDEDLLNALIEELVAQRDAMAAAAEDYTNRMREVTHDETFKNLTDSFISSLLDTNKTAEDWANEIGRTMAQRIIEQMIAPTMLQPLLDALQEAYNDASEKEGAVWKDIINNQSIQDALADIRKVYPDLQETVKTILQGLGVTIDETKEGFSDLKGTFVSFLTDLNKTAEDFGKDLGRTMAEQMIDALMDKKYGDELKKLNEDWADALEEGDPEKIEAIRQKILQLYKTIGDDEELQKLREAFRELNESTPFDNLKSSYLSTLMDMKKDTKDFVDDINKMIAEDFIKQFVMGDAFDEKLAEWKKQYQKITSDGNLSEKERLRQLKALAELIGSERDSMQAEANSILTLLGLNQSGNDSATMNMADKATYDQFELYLGIANAHLMVSEQHKQISEQILTTLQTIGNVGSGVNYQELIYMRLGTTNEYLLATKRLVSSIEAKMDTIAQQLSKL